MPDTPPSQKRACDQCHRRKVKCEISQPPNRCRNCKGSGLECTYNSVPQKKGPKGSRAKVITEIRDHQRRTPVSSRPSSQIDSDGSSASPVPGCKDIPLELVTSCVEFFFRMFLCFCDLPIFWQYGKSIICAPSTGGKLSIVQDAQCPRVENVYPTQPILERSRLQQHISEMVHSAEAYCLVVSLCAYMLIQPGMQIPASLYLRNFDNLGANQLGEVLLADTVEVRKSISFIEKPSVTTVQTSFFLFGCYFNLENHAAAWYHLRESTTFAILLGMHQEQSYHGAGSDEKLKRRLFWLLFVTERAYALQAQRPLSLHDSIALPTIQEGYVETAELTGFLHLINLFRPFDDTFVGLWNQSTDVTSADWVSKLQDQLADALPTYLRSTESQTVDLRTSQQWLRMMVWQLSISHRLLSSNARSDSLTFKFPMELSRQLAKISGFSQKSMEVHGIGLVKKVFDVACTLIDVMSFVPLQPQSLELEPRDFLHQFIQLISRLRGGRERYLPLLLSKVNDSLPRLPTGGSVPYGLRSLPSSIDGQFEEVLEDPSHLQEDNLEFPYTNSSTGPTACEIEEYSDSASNSPYSTNAGGGSPYTNSLIDPTFMLDAENPYSA